MRESDRETQTRNILLTISNQQPTICFDMSGFLAIVAGSIVPRLASALLICRRSGGTSSSIVWLVSRTLYDICFICRVFCKRLPPNCFGRDCARDFGVLYGGCRSITHICNESFPRRWETTQATLISLHPRLSSPEPRSGSLNFCTHLDVSGLNWILSSTVEHNYYQVHVG